MINSQPSKIAKKREKMMLIKQNIVNDYQITRLFSDAHNIVFGEGNLAAKVMLIGEAPGKNEDLTGKPFMGASGKILNKLLASINLSRSNTYITNIVKYRPVANRDPSRIEKELFLPYLLQQISLIKPKLIITLGRHSLNCLKPKSFIKDNHGKILSIELADLLTDFQADNIDNKFSFPLIPMYHPAATIYNHKLADVLADDFLRIPTLISNKLTI